jgi:flagellar L-ring protein precursor FlgH
MLIAAMTAASTAAGQTTSVRKRQTPGAPTQESKREARERPGNRVLEAHSMVAVPVEPPKTLKVHDLITIIVRQQRTYESDGELQTKKRFEIASQLDAFIKFMDGGIGASTFSRGKPNIDYRFGQRIKNESDKDREDRLITRITAEIIDVKPNGTLVVQARSEIRFENEVAKTTLTGTCRKEDVTPDNTVLSTQLANLAFDAHNSGAVRDGSRRGWLVRFLDLIRPV